MDHGHSTFDVEYEDTEMAPRRRARALLIYVFAIRTALDGDERIQMIEKAATANGTKACDVKTEVSKLVDELQYFVRSGASSRWTAGFYDVFDGSYAMKVVTIDEATKIHARGKFKCTLCGQIEQSCGYAVHFAGSPPIERGQDLPKYSAKAFHTSDPEKLASAFARYANSYNTAVGTSSIDELERKWPASPYLGTIFPGKTCLKSIFTAFSAQDFVRSMIDATESIGYETFAFPFECIPERLVAQVASRLEQHFACARGQASPPSSHNNNDNVFWDELFERFSYGVGIKEEDTYTFLREGYLRMEKNVTKTGYCPECDDESDEEDVYAVVRGPRQRKRRIIVSDYEEDEEVEEDGVGEESSMEEFIENDSGEDHADGDVGRPTLPTPRWGQTNASRSGPFAMRRQAVHEPFVNRETRAARRRDEATSSSHEVSVANSEQEAYPILRALASVDKHTARNLRAPSNHQIGSRRSTMVKLGDLAMSTLKEGDLTLSSGLLRALYVLTDTLSVHEVGCSLAPEQRVKKLREVTDTLLLPIKTRLLRSGQIPEGLCVAEAIIVAHELLE